MWLVNADTCIYYSRDTASETQYAIAKNHFTCCFVSLAKWLLPVLVLRETSQCAIVKNRKTVPLAVL